MVAWCTDIEYGKGEVKAWGYRIPSIKLVSSRWMSTRMKDISLRVFSKITLGSSDRQRRQLGAMTMARLFTSILVMATLTGCANTYEKQAHIHKPSRYEPFFSQLA